MYDRIHNNLATKAQMPGRTERTFGWFGAMVVAQLTRVQTLGTNPVCLIRNFFWLPPECVRARGSLDSMTNSVCLIRDFFQLPPGCVRVCGGV
uniref:Uncharacterized protein n=1 Tax=Arundo donax TaxID=35708 RepID=A0A0A8ZQ86_ARUDO